jgi:hypothetical protein
MPLVFGVFSYGIGKLLFNEWMCPFMKGYQKVLKEKPLREIMCEK